MAIEGRVQWLCFGLFQTRGEKIVEFRRSDIDNDSTFGFCASATEMCWIVTAVHCQLARLVSHAKVIRLQLFAFMCQMPEAFAG
jgi:hypothetical protein